MSNQNTIIRLTINVDFNEPTEVGLLRAVMRRLNVLSAKSKPRSAVATILGDARLRDQLEIGRQRTRNRANNVISLPDRTQQTDNLCHDPACNLRNFTHSHGSQQQPSGDKSTTSSAQPSKMEVQTQRFEPPSKLKFKYIRLNEIRFEPPAELPGLEDACPAAA